MDGKLFIFHSQNVAPYRQFSQLYTLAMWSDRMRSGHAADVHAYGAAELERTSRDASTVVFWHFAPFTLIRWE